MEKVEEVHFGRYFLVSIIMHKNLTLMDFYRSRSFDDLGHWSRQLYFNILKLRLL